MARKLKQDSVQVMLAPNKQIAFDDRHIPYREGVMLASNKFDGNRCFCRAGDLLTRNMLDQPNQNLPAFLADMVRYASDHELCFDMELLIPDATHHGVHGKVFNSHTAEIPKNTTVNVFDCLTLEEWNDRCKNVVPFSERIKRYQAFCAKVKGPYLSVGQRPIRSAEEAQDDFEKAIDRGYEGIMLRNATAGYKQARCGHKGAWMLKFKAEATVDGVVTEVVQMRKMKDGIERTRNTFGRLETPTRNEDNYDLQDSVGALVVRTEDGAECKVSFAAGVADADERRRLWADRKNVVGRWVEIKVFAVGAKDALRSGRIVRWRDDKAGTPTPKRKKA